MADNPHYPLRWPFGWPRTPDSERLASSAYKVHPDKARRQMLDELRKLGGEDLIINSNVPTRQDGSPYAGEGRRKIKDPGVAIYFKIKGQPKTMARDKYMTPEDNLRDLGLAIRDMRSLELHGGSTMVTRAFEGFTMLPPPESCWVVLGMSQSVPRTRATVMKYFKIAAEAAQSGNGGDLDRIVRARDRALGEIKS